MRVPPELREQLIIYFEDLRIEYQDFIASDNTELKPLVDILNEETFIAGAEVFMFSLAHHFTIESLVALRVIFDRDGTFDDFCELLRLLGNDSPSELQ